MEPKTIMLMGFLLVLFGFVGPFLMVIGVLESTFILNFASYAASISGLLLGIVGAAYYVRLKKE